MIESLLKTLLYINILAYAMVVLRPKLYKTELYSPMLTNIKLSLFPLLILFALTTVVVLIQASLNFIDNVFLINTITIIVMIIGLVIWLLLLPNSGYLITELNFNHREQDTVEVPLWYDIVSILTLAMSGVMNMCFNVFFIQFFIALALNDLVQNVSFLIGNVSWLVMALLMVLCSFGIYLGRYIRFNSWDIKHPIEFTKKLINHFNTKESIKNCALFVLFHSLFFIVFYQATVGVVLEQLISLVNM